MLATAEASLALLLAIPLYLNLLLLRGRATSDARDGPPARHTVPDAGVPRDGAHMNLASASQTGG